MELGREGSILGDWNANSQFWDETREKDARGKIMEECMVGAGWIIREGDCGPTWERTREGRRESSRIDFVISKGNSEWLPIKSTKLLLDHWGINEDWEVDMTRKVDKRVVVDWRKLDKIVEDLKEKN